MAKFKVLFNRVDFRNDKGVLEHRYGQDEVVDLDPADPRVTRFVDLKAIKAVESEKKADDDRPAGNASKDTWADYAKAQGVPVADDAKRDDIVAAVDAKHAAPEGADVDVPTQTIAESEQAGSSPYGPIPLDEDNPALNPEAVKVLNDRL